MGWKIPQFYHMYMYSSGNVPTSQGVYDRCQSKGVNMYVISYSYDVLYICTGVNIFHDAARVKSEHKHTAD